MHDADSSQVVMVECRLQYLVLDYIISKRSSADFPTVWLESG